MHLPPPKPLLKPWHPADYTNRSLEWFGGDNAEQYTENCRTKKGFAKYCRRVGWDQPGVIRYDFNSEGFRSPEFTHGSSSLLTLGCSFTFGSGLPAGHTWPVIMAQRLNMTLNNFSWPGASLDACFRWAEYWIPQLRPGLVVLMMPPAPRIELILDQSDRHCFSYGVYMDLVKQDWFVETWMLVDENQRLNQSKNCLAIQAICSNLGIPCWTYDSMSFAGQPKELIGWARDWLHPGTACHQMLVEFICHDQKFS